MPDPTRRELLRNPFLLGYLVFYAALLAAMHLREGFSVAEPLFLLLVVGVGFSLLAAWSARGLTPRPVPVRHPGPECTLLAGYLVVVVAFLTWGISALPRADASVPGALLLLAAKLGVFVIAPFLLWRSAWDYRATDFVHPTLGLRGHWRPVLWMSAALLLLQLVAGRSLREFHLHPVAAKELAIGAPLVFLWLVLEVGLVEEYFFRVLLQARIAAFARSEITGIVLMALLFGLAHAPGFYLRPGATGEALGHAPSLLFAVGYSVVVTSVTGFFLGVLWARTRNLVAVAAIHAAGDLLPGLPRMLHLWRSLWPVH